MDNDNLHNTELNFRKAKSEDLGILNKISVMSKSYWGYPKEWLEHWKEELVMTAKDLDSLRITVVERLSEPIGFCAVEEKELEFEIVHLWVIPEYIGCGYGGQLLRKSLQGILTGTKPVKVVSDPNVEGFYEKFGFETIDQEESYPKGRFLPVMRKTPSQT